MKIKVSIYNFPNWHKQILVIQHAWELLVQYVHQWYRHQIVVHDLSSLESPDSHLYLYVL